MRLIAGSLLLLLALNAYSQESVVEEKIRAAMSADIRSESDTARDRNRRPVETLAFFQLRDDMRVLELLPGGGWYTKILAPVLRDNGEMYVAIGTNNVRNNLMRQDGFGDINVIDVDIDTGDEGPHGKGNTRPFSFGVSDLDLVVTFRNMHNYTEAGRRNVNDAVFASLKSGGFYGVIDHSRRHMQELNGETTRRVDPVQIIKELLGSGFEFVDWSDLHYRADDELRFEVGRASVTGNTDRFTLLFRKP
jgi:predicted methyltransferase